MTTDMKEVIEWARANGNCTKGEFELLLALAEIGRLAVECQATTLKHQHSRSDKAKYAISDAVEARRKAADAFLARQNGDK